MMKIDNFIIKRDDTLLLIIDIQERLFEAMKEKIQKKIKKNTSILIETAKIYNIPVVVTEQYKKGLGQSIPELYEKVMIDDIYEKIHFDCMKDEVLNRVIREKNKKTVIITGIEAHVCVLQTAVSLLNDGKKVIIASDAVGSRRKHDWLTAMSALSSAGAVIYSTESISFILLDKAGTPEFKSISPMFK